MVLTEPEPPSPAEVAAAEAAKKKADEAKAAAQKAAKKLYQRGKQAERNLKQRIRRRAKAENKRVALAAEGKSVLTGGRRPVPLADMKNKGGKRLVRHWHVCASVELPYVLHFSGSFRLELVIESD